MPSGPTSEKSIDSIGDIRLVSFQNLDPNRLRVLDAKLRERNTTRVSQKLKLSQPAVSARLSRAGRSPLRLSRGKATYTAWSMQLCKTAAQPECGAWCTEILWHCAIHRSDQSHRRFAESVRDCPGRAFRYRLPSCDARANSSAPVSLRNTAAPDHRWMREQILGARASRRAQVPPTLRGRQGKTTASHSRG